MTVNFNRQIFSDVKTIAGEHKNIIFSVTENDEGELVFSFDSERNICRMSRKNSLTVWTEKPV